MAKRLNRINVRRSHHNSIVERKRIKGKYYVIGDDGLNKEKIPYSRKISMMSYRDQYKKYGTFQKGVYLKKKRLTNYYEVNKYISRKIDRKKVKRKPLDKIIENSKYNEYMKNSIVKGKKRHGVSYSVGVRVKEKNK